MMEWRERHPWKWLGAPCNGVLGLFAPHTMFDEGTTAHAQQNEPSHVGRDAVEREKHDPNNIKEPPFAVTVVLLGMEVVMAHAVGMLLVWSGSMTKRIAWRLLEELTSAAMSSVLAEAISSWLLMHGLTAFAARMFKQDSKLLFLRRLGLLSSPFSFVLLLSVVLQILLLAIIAAFYDKKVSVALSQLATDAAAAPAQAFRSIFLAPVEEELMFRGVVFHLVVNRLRSVTPGALVNSVCFGAVHLANLANSHSTAIPSLQVPVQVVWACVFGFVVSLRYVQKGSLSECVALHVVNNTFAALLSATLPDH